MKRNIITLIGFIIILTSCNKDPRIDLIRDYEQNIDGTITDLSLKVKEIKDIGTINALDSLKYWENELELQSPIYNLGLLIGLTESKISSQEYLLKSLIELRKIGGKVSNEEIEETKEGIATNEKELEESKKWLENAEKNGDYTGSPFNYYQIRIDKYKSLGNTILVNIVNCTYTIKNPFLNNVTQTITEKYYFSPDNTKLFGVENEDE